MSLVWFRVIEYTLSVRGYMTAPSSSFVMRRKSEGKSQAFESDMFRIDVTQKELAHGVTLQDFQAAFLTSPLFRLELWILRMAGAADAETTTPSHLENVAQGNERGFGPWIALANEMKRDVLISEKSSGTSACRIMRAYFQGTYSALSVETFRVLDSTLITDYLGFSHFLANAFQTRNPFVTLGGP